jgi:hypothetical protein
MNARELLELAARAAELKIGFRTRINSRIGKFGLIEYTNCEGYWVDGKQWNPLFDDGDAFRLAVKLRLSVDTDWYNSDACWYTEKTIVTGLKIVEEEPHLDDPYAATRLAIVKAAAELGRGIHND